MVILEIAREVRNLKNICISNLILIILNKDEDDIVRKCAEIELRKRILHLDYQYDDLLHREDRIISERGFDVEEYLFSPNVNMQQLMETYFKYNCCLSFEDNQLLLSEKILCNDADFGIPFFSKICKREIVRLDERIKSGEEDSETLEYVKALLEERNKDFEEYKKEMSFEERLDFNDMLGVFEGLYFEAFNNYDDKDMYNYLKSKIKFVKMLVLYFLNENLFELDIMQNLYGLRFARKDSAKLRKQKSNLLSEQREFNVDYKSDDMQLALKRIKSNPNPNKKLHNFL